MRLLYRPAARRPRIRAASLCLLLAALPTAGGASPGSPLPASVPPVEIPLWPAAAPGSEALAAGQRVVERSRDPRVPDRYAERIGTPSLAIYRPARPDGRGLLVVPGGGYQRVVLDKEGSALVPAFAEAGGLTLFVLRYRLPGEGHASPREVPLADAQRALRLIRHRAAEWGVDPDGLGVMGFSAGGHVAGSLATRHAERVYPPVDAADTRDARPAYALLVYPVIDMGAHAHPGSRRKLLGEAPDAAAVRAYSLQNRVGAATPPVFLLHAQDDEVVPVENTLLFEAALRDAGIEHETHLYARGGHGFGVRQAAGTLARWPSLALAWIDAHAPAPAPAPAPQD